MSASPSWWSIKNHISLTVMSQIRCERYLQRQYGVSCAIITSIYIDNSFSKFHLMRQHFVCPIWGLLNKWEKSPPWSGQPRKVYTCGWFHVINTWIYDFFKTTIFLLQRDHDMVIYYVSRFYPSNIILGQVEIRMIKLKVQLKVCKIYTIPNRMKESLII